MRTTLKLNTHSKGLDRSLTHASFGCNVPHHLSLNPPVRGCDIRHQVDKLVDRDHLLRTNVDEPGRTVPSMHSSI
jgi:hypothetical protein